MGISFLYIGQHQEGSTSRMRANKLRKILSEYSFSVIDTNKPFTNANRVAQSLGFRFKRGPLIKTINGYIRERIHGIYDVIWVDKGVYIDRGTIDKLRNSAKKLIHYTPDPALIFHKSHHFTRSLQYYDFTITTKSYELDEYYKYVTPEQILLVSQGFDKAIHFPRNKFSQKKAGVIFVGHFEKERGEIAYALARSGIPVTIAGRKWKSFMVKNADLTSINFLGEGVYGDEYCKQISLHMFGLGCLSKWIPELHTTRTFEIPACGTALITESNDETTAFFQDNEVVFYVSIDELVNKVSYLLNHTDKLQSLTMNGLKKVKDAGYDYESILRKIITQIGL